MGNIIASRATAAEPVLSIQISGRDDDYMPDFFYRLSTTLNFLAMGLARIGRLNEVEILVTDWGSKTPMADTIKVSPEAQRICQFLYVPPDVAREIQKGNDRFQPTLAFNAALRRAQGRFVMLFAGDTLFTVPGLDSLLRLLRGEQPIDLDVERTYFLCRRYQVPWQFVRRQPSLREWERNLLHAGEYDKDGIFSISAGAGAMLASRQNWVQMRGLDEQMSGWGGNDVDFGLRIAQILPWVDLNCVGVSCFHMEHPPREGRRSVAIGAPSSYHYIYNTGPQANDEAWGLAKFQVITQKPRCEQQAGDAEGTPVAVNRPVAQATATTELHRRLTRELNSGSVLEIIRNAVQSYRTVAFKRQFSQDELDVMFLLTWYSHKFFPTRFLDFGATQGFALLGVCTACPGIEAYHIEKWDDIEQKQDPCQISYDVSRASKHRGYLRLLNGDPNTGLERLRNTFGGPCKFDLILVCEDSGYDTGKILTQAVDLLAPDAGLVLKARSAESFAALWAKVAGTAGYVSFPLARSNAGIILREAANTGKAAMQLPAIPVGRWKARLLSAAMFRHVPRPLLSPWKYKMYADRVLNRLWSRFRSAG